MIYLFNNREELVHILAEEDLVEFTHTVKINAFDEAEFEVALSVNRSVFEGVAYFGFFTRDRVFGMFKLYSFEINQGYIIKGLDRAESDLRTVGIIKDKRPKNVTADQALTVALEGTGYHLGEVRGLTHVNSLNFYYISPREALVKIIEAFNCEFRVRYTFAENKVIGRYIDLYKKQGVYTGVQFEYGDNALEVVYEENSDDVVTALIGRGKGEETESESGEATGGYGRRIEFTDVVWSKSAGKPVDKPAGQNYVVLMDDFEEKGLFQDGAVKHRWGVYVNEDITDKELLLQRTFEELERLNNPLRIYKAEILDIGSDIWLGDRIGIVRDEVGVAFEARIFKIVIDKLNFDQSSVELGDYETLKNHQNSSSQAVRDAINSALDEQAQSMEAFNIRLQEELNRRNKEFDEQVRVFKLEMNNGIEQAKAKAEEEAQKLRDETNQKFTAFDKSFRESSAENQRQISQALQKVGANEVLANEAKNISSQVLADLGKVRQDAGELSETVAQDIANFKSQVGSQLGGLATKVEVEQAEGRLTERFAQMKVGGRNYLRNSQFKQGARFWQEWQSTQFGLQFNYEHSGKADNRNRVGAHFWYHQTHAGIWYGLQQRFVFEGKRGDKVTVSLLVAKDGNASGLKVGLHYRNNDTIVGQEWQEVPSASIDRAYKRVVLTFTLSADTKELNLMLFGEQGKTVNLYVTDVKLETGTIATDWSPAPEDGEAEISAAKAEFTKTAEGITQKLTAVESYVSKDGERSEALRRYSREETARQITAERSAVARDYVAKSSFDETVKGINRRFENVLAPVDGKIASKIAEYGKGVDGRFETITSQLNGKVNTTDFQKVQATAQLYERIIGSTEKDVTDKVARMVMTNQMFQTEVGKVVKVGGTNLVRNSGPNLGNTSFWSGTAGLWATNQTHTFYKNGKAPIFNIYTSKAELAFIQTSVVNKLEKNTDYTLSFLGFMGGNVSKFRCMVGLLSDTDHRWKRTFHVYEGRLSSSRAERIVVKFNSGDYDGFSLRFDHFGSSDGKGAFLGIAEIKVEKGTIATDWSPAPEDVEQKVEAVSTRVTQLNNSWAVQNLTSAGQVVSQINLLGRNAGIKADTIRLDGQTLANRIDAYEGRFNKLFVADGTFSKLNAGIIGADAIDAKKIRVDSQLAQKLVADKAFVSKFFAENAVIGAIKAIDIDAGRVTSGVLNAKNGAMNIDLNNANVNINNNTAAIRRVENGFATQFLKMETGIPLVHVDGGAKASLLTIGANHLKEDSGVGFTGLKIWNGKAQRRTTADLIEVVGERIQLRSHKNGGIIVDLQSKETVFYSDSSALILGHPNRRLSDVITNNVDIAGVGSVKGMLGKLQSCFVALRQAEWDTKAQHFKNHINGLF